MCIGFQEGGSLAGKLSNEASFTSSRTGCCTAGDRSSGSDGVTPVFPQSMGRSEPTDFENTRAGKLKLYIAERRFS
jgi:hypothetical protein